MGIVNFLKKINNIPLPLTIKHYFVPSTPVKSIDSPEDWDILRTADSHFVIYDNREDWLKVAEGKLKQDGHSGSFLRFSEEVSRFVKERGIKSVFSVGVGVGGLEYQIKKKYPEIKITCSEYAPKSVELLKKVFTEADSIIQFDIKDKWPNFGDDELVLMYRVDPHLTDMEWKKLFSTINAKHILFIPNTFLTVKSLVNRYINRLKNLNKKFVFSGYVRSKEGYKSFWKGSFKNEEINFYGNTGFYLNKK